MKTKYLKLILISAILLMGILLFGWLYNSDIFLAKRMTEEEAVRTLFNYLYSEEGDDSLISLVEPSEYEFQLPGDMEEEHPEIIESWLRKMWCESLTEDGLYYIISVYTFRYVIRNGERDFSLSTYDYNGHYAVNRETGEVIERRWRDPETYEWIYSEEYERITQQQ